MAGRRRVEHDAAAERRLAPEHDAIAARRDERLLEPELRVAGRPAGRPAPGTADVPWQTSTRAPSATSPSSATSRRKLTGYARGATSASPRVTATPSLGADRDGDALAGLGALDRLTVHLDAANAHLEARREDVEPIAGGDVPDQSVPVATVPAPGRLKTRST